jgi:hypothetical protein
MSASSVSLCFRQFLGSNGQALDYEFGTADSIARITLDREIFDIVRADRPLSQ